MKKIIVVMLSAIVVSCSMLYACDGHCDFDNPKYAEDTKIFDDAMAALRYCIEPYRQPSRKASSMPKISLGLW